MKQGLIVILLSFSIIYSNQVIGQINPDEILDRFFRGYKSEPLKSIDYIFSFNPIFKTDAKAQADLVRQRLEQAIPSLGRYFNRELIIKQDVSKNLRLYSYLMRYERQPIRFTFKFYKPDREWLLLGFSFDDDLSAEMDEAARLMYILNARGNN